MSIIVRRIRNKEDLKNVFYVRYKVFVDEFKFMCKKAFPDKQEKDGYDFLSTTVHFLAVHDDRSIGAARLLGPNKKMVNKNNKKIFGLAIEDLYDLTAYQKHNLIPYEISRSSIITNERSSRAIMDIWKAAVMYIRVKKIDTVCSCAGTETDNKDDAEIIYQLLKLKGFFHKSISTKPVIESAVKPKPKYSLYDKKVVQEINKKKDLTITKMDYYNKKGIKLPATLDYYSRIGFKFTGPPVLFPKFRMFTMPMVLDMNNINEPFNTFFQKENPYIEI